jgi:hypothetical protein
LIDTFKYGFATNGDIAYFLTNGNLGYEKVRTARALGVESAQNGVADLIQAWSDNDELDHVTIFRSSPRFDTVEVRRNFKWDRRRK